MSNNEKVLDRLLYILLFCFLFLASSFFMFELLVKVSTPNRQVLGASKVVRTR